ncbi:hypothetical protein L3Q82_016621 [Scortum barcoo]|uniref:Uncharacterized protein n=1 Tax=Scortum barcoo TaxID=214431 RepID=A0ACB8X801_9TELE|nr:hypothetical protein L3Q82_016621 [Scortum barcoo]
MNLSEEPRHNFSEMLESLQAINKQLRPLQIQLHKVKRQLDSCESLETVFDTMVEEEKVARQKYISLQAELQPLLDKVNNHRVMENTYEEKKASNEKLNDASKDLEIEINRLKNLADREPMEGRISELEAQNEALKQDHEVLQKELEDLQGKVHHIADLEEKCVFMNKFTETMTLQNNAMREEILQLKEKHQKVFESYNAAKAEKEAICQENDALQLKAFGDLCREKLDSMDELKKENNNLQEKIKVAEEQLMVKKYFKKKYEELIDMEKVLQEHSNVLIKTHSNAFKKLLNEEDWRYKHDKLNEQTEALKQKNNRVTEEIQIFNEQLGDLSAFKVKYKSLNEEKRALKNQNNSLQKDLHELQKKQSIEQGMVEKNNLIQAENTALKQQICTLQLRVEKIQNILQVSAAGVVTFLSAAARLVNKPARDPAVTRKSLSVTTDNDESHYRAEVEHLAAWCADNNLLLNTSKTKELIVDFRKVKRETHDPIHINGMAVERVSSFKFLGTHISENLDLDCKHLQPD